MQAAVFIETSDIVDCSDVTFHSRHSIITSISGTIHDILVLTVILRHIRSLIFNVLSNITSQPSASPWIIEIQSYIGQGVRNFART